MARPRKEETRDFAAMIEDFKARFPKEWEEIRLGPTLYGVDVIAEKLKG